MIKVKVKRLSPEFPLMTAYQVTGHAFYDEPGKDIVCSAVSAISVGTVNAIERLTGVKPQAKMRKGYLEVTLPSDYQASANDQVQLLLESMLVMLDTIEQSYGQYIKIETSFKEGG